eukprot:GGOE01018150.1.p1 GENE.GGOE01018150.1~~GGOE01018150.1.p1  ORF type:complete len:716 (-),score=151.85 GGOE01018150.1:362-2275(-)
MEAAAKKRLVFPLCQSMVDGSDCKHGTKCYSIHLGSRAWEARREWKIQGAGGGSNAQKFKTELCRDFQNGKCSRGNSCQYAHGERDLRGRERPAGTNSKYKTELCRDYTAGRCMRGDDCQFAHGEDDIRGGGRDRGRDRDRDRDDYSRDRDRSRDRDSYREDSYDRDTGKRGRDDDRSSYDDSKRSRNEETRNMPKPLPTGILGAAARPGLPGPGLMLPGTGLGLGTFGGNLPLSIGAPLGGLGTGLGGGLGGLAGLAGGLPGQLPGGLAGGLAGGLGSGLLGNNPLLGGLGNPLSSMAGGNSMAGGLTPANLMGNLGNLQGNLGLFGVNFPPGLQQMNLAGTPGLSMPGSLGRPMGLQGLQSGLGLNPGQGTNPLLAQHGQSISPALPQALGGSLGLPLGMAPPQPPGPIPPQQPLHQHQQQQQLQQSPQLPPQPMMPAPLPTVKPVPGPPRQHTGGYRSREFVFTSHHDGNGIIFFMGLNRKDGKWYNPVDTRKLRVIAASLDSGTLPMTVDQEFNELLYASKDEFPSWVVFDFLECSVRPTYYSLAHKGILQAYMRSWKFQGSHDAANWDTLCIHTNDISLSKQNTVASWAVQTNTPYRYLRIMLEQGGNAEGTSVLMFNAFEVYGDFHIPTDS